jgi:fluoroacetyl-CoA thioesterase
MEFIFTEAYGHQLFSFVPGNKVGNRRFRGSFLSRAKIAAIGDVALEHETVNRIRSMENAMTDIEVGRKGSVEIIVETQDLASFSGNLGAEVLSTPRLVLLMENACRKALEGYLPEGTITVGTRIEMKHFAATPLGMKVRAGASLREVHGRRLLFDVSASDEVEKISEGVHERFIVSIDRFVGKVRKKQAVARGPD